MSGDERVRACGDCKKNVYNLSEMTRDEAEALIVAKEGRLCVRYYQRKDGTILLADCTIGVSKRRKRRIIAAGAAALLAGGAIFAGREAYKKHKAEHEIVMGGAEPIHMQGELVQDPVPVPPKADDRVVDVKTPEVHKVMMGKMSVSPPKAPPKAPQK